MEKIIKIDPTLIPEKKHTKKNDTVNKKAEINAILEKYNLKTPKKSKVLDKTTNFQIKAKPKVEEQIINVVKQQPSKQPTVVDKPISPPTRPISPPPKQLTIVDKPISLVTRPISPPLKQPTIVNKPISLVTRPISPPINKNTQQFIKTIQPIKTIQTTKPNVSVQTLLDKDKKVIEIAKNEMPTAIINKNNANDFFSSNNIYKIIPTRTEAFRDGSSVNRTDNSRSQLINKIVEAPLKQSGGNIKRININPNANEAEVNFDSNYENFENGNNSNNNGNNGNNSNSNGNSNNKYNPDRNIIIQPKTISSNHIKRISPVAPKVYISNNNVNNINNESTISNVSKNASNSNELNQLEMQRIHLQEQQQKELEKLKHKKSQILKIHNRKKEFELMKSIEIEKTKLRMIQQKQIELNNIMDKQINEGNINKSQNQPQNHTKTISIGTTAKRIPASLIYNIDAKKTKKNIETVTKPRHVIDVVTSTRASAKGASAPLNPLITENNSNNEKISEVPLENINNIKENDLENIIEKDKEQCINENVTISKDKGFKGAEAPSAEVPSAPAKKLNFPSQKELYNRENFKESLTISLGIQPIFNKLKLKKDKLDIEEKKDILTSIYDFKHLEKFKDNTIDMIYKIIKFDNIIIK